MQKMPFVEHDSKLKQGRSLVSRVSQQFSLPHCVTSLSSSLMLVSARTKPYKPWTHRFYATSKWLLQSFSPWNHLLECCTDCLQLAPHFVSFCKSRLTQNSPSYSRLASPLSESSVAPIHPFWRVQWLDRKLHRPVDEKLGEVDCHSNL